MATRRMVPMQPQRIMVYGVTGSGKSSLAARISEATGIPWTSVDDEIGWLPGWVSRPQDEQRDLITDVVARDEWILDSAYGAWLELPMSRVELIVGLDYSRWLSLARLVRRTARRVLSRDKVCNGNVEGLREVFSRDSIIVWHFRSFHRKRTRIRGWAADPDGPTVVHLRSPRATERWLVAQRGAAHPTRAHG